MTNAPSLSPRPITASTQLGGIIGRGISHSLSPFIHNTSASLLGIDVAYLAFDFPEMPPMVFFDVMRQANCFGFNITVPYKESAAQLLAPGALKSCNTLVNKAVHWEAASTDAEGFVRGLKDLGHTLEDFQAIVCLGYGGAAKALIEAFRQSVAETPILVLMRGSNVRQLEAAKLTVREFHPEALKKVLETYPKALLIQCTSAPLRGEDLSEFCPSLQGFQGAFVDLVYGRPSALLNYSAQRGIPCQDGIPMLLAQALASQKLWWGQSADFSLMKTAISAYLS